MGEIIKERLLKGIVTKKIEAPAEFEAAGLELAAAIRKAFKRSLNIREVDTGSCGICEAEIIAANNPIYDLSRFGVNFVASPRHADALLVTGPVSKNMLLALRKTYDAVPAPKFVISLGDCARDGGLFKDSYYIEGGVDKVLPVVLHIPGCPPAPLTIIKSLLSFLKGL
ncbi:MAG: NADH-quinone oxidoreductase subunit NuoB [Candidatus Margulisbacteria bacterium]|nr:NADH-quinone oxidoreductase subunit NuoB [Candidatus Margulisiibacteriota bacterium]